MKAGLAAVFFGVVAMTVWTQHEPPGTPPTAAAAVRPYSNILPEDYIGPEACGKCHEENYRLWERHPHSRMNANAGPDTVLGDFSSPSISYDGFSDGADRLVPAGQATFYQEGDDYMVKMSSPSGEFQRRFKIIRTIGWRLVQMYVGIQLEGPEPETDPMYRTELRLPFGYDIARQRWHSTPFFDHGYVMESTEDPIAQTVTPGLDVWTTNCATCHNTYPYSQRWHVDTSYHAGYRRTDFVGSAAVPATGAVIQADELVTLGISCESCHFGGREHAESLAPIRFVPTNENLRFARPGILSEELPEQKTPYVVQAICRQCHGRPIPTYPSGGVDANSAEAYDMREACAGQIKCTDCHNPHTAGPPQGGGADEPAHLAACVRCHTEYAEPDAAAAHSRHPASVEVNCLDCHMPRVIQGLKTVTRTHHISSPTDLGTYVAGAPNACSLCHLDKTLVWALDTMAERWELGRVRPQAKSNIPAHLPAGEYWLKGADQVRRIVAAEAYARSPLGKEALPAILEALGDPYPFARFLIRPAVERILGRTLTEREYDIAAPAELREQQLEALLLKETTPP